MGVGVLAGIGRHATEAKLNAEIHVSHTESNTCYSDECPRSWNGWTAPCFY